VTTNDTLASAASLVDRRAPGFVRFLAALRWGGLRTIDPGGLTWGAEAAAGLGLGFGAREAVRAASRGRIRVPLVAALATGWVVSHLALWRWDTVRWRSRRVALVVDLPLDAVIDLAAQLCDDGLTVERWERGIRGSRRIHGLWCRAGDVRAVNRAIDDEVLVSR
jgi:hypothetical protein